MNIQSIMCIFNGTDDELNAVNTALLFSKFYGAKVRFLHISRDPDTYSAMYGCGDAYACTALIEACKNDNKERLEKARQYVIALSAQHHVPLDTTDIPAHYASATFTQLTGNPEEIIACEGRLSDLIIVGQKHTNTLHDSAIIAALFNTGCPVMLVPQQEAKRPEAYKTIAVAWKGTPESARAMHNAMPFLDHAEKVYMLMAEEADGSRDINAEAALMEYLRTHALRAQCILVAVGDHTPAEALLMRAKELNADLLVMGAYSHSRFREMILGGVTDYMLKNSDIPLLLSH